MYSSVFDGIVTDPVLMTVPVDDHMVHRGDGIFEAFKCVNGRIYNMWAHLDRLQHSASVVGQKLPCTADDIAGIVVETVRAGGQRDCIIRLYVSRGPGSFDANPYACPRPELYVVATGTVESFMETHPQGATVRTSSVSAKTPFFARVKSCNYLQNALMKKEAVEAGVDLVVWFSEEGCLLEGATANVGIVTKEGMLSFPELERVLRGTTMIRVMDLAKALVETGELSGVGFADISRRAVLESRELLLTGTTLDVSMAREFDGERVGGGEPGPIFTRLRGLLLEDMASNEAVLTTVFSGG